MRAARLAGLDDAGRRRDPDSSLLRAPICARRARRAIVAKAWRRRGNDVTILDPVRDGLWRLPIQLAGHSVGHVNMYVLAAGDELLVVDTGWTGARDQLDAALAELGRSVDDIRVAITTHLHADHCGMARQLQASGAHLAMPEHDARLLPQRYFGQRHVFRTAFEDWCATVGLPEEAMEAAEQQMIDSGNNVDEFVPDDFLVDGQRVVFGDWDLEVIHTPGHTPGHACLYEHTTGVLFTGDHVFPRIRANPNARPFSTPDPVGDYLRAIDRLGARDVSVALPGHQEPFSDFAARLDELRDYHRERLDEIVDALREGPHTAYEVAARLRRSRAWADQSWFPRLTAVGETHAHLLHLVVLGRVRATDASPVRWSHIAA